MNTDSLLPILGELLAKSFAILLLAALLVRLWRGATAAQRHLVCFAAIVTILLLPTTRLVTPWWAVPLQHDTKIRVPITVLPLAPMGESNIPVTFAVPAPRPRVWTASDWRKVLPGVWLTGTVLLIGYRLLGSWRLHQLKRRSATLDDPRIRLLLSRTLSELGMRHRPEIRLSAECRVPITWGTLRPVMLLPRQALQWNDVWLVAALRHETAHILRHDYLTRWIAQIACAIYWPNPFIWLAARSLRVAQEQAADDLVLRAGTPADQYATQLVAAARIVATQGFLVRQAVAMACPSTLEDRVRAIVDGRRERHPLSRLAVVLGSGMALLILALCTVAQLQGADEKPSVTKETTTAKFQGPEIEFEAKFVEIAAGAARETTPTPDKPTIYSDPEFQSIVRALNEKKGVDILSSPRVTTRSNHRAVMEVIREFRYPTEWEKDGDAWKPGKSETKNVGTTLDVEPRIKENGSLELHTVANVVVFLGFVDLDDNKALPAAKDALDGGAAHPPIVPPGHRFKSVFSERKQEFTVEVKSGQTVGIPELPEKADVKPFERNAPNGKLVLFISSRILEAAAVVATPKTGSVSALDGTEGIASRLIIPKLELRDATLQEAVAVLQQKATELSDTKTPLKVLCNGPADGDSARITVSLTNIPLIEAAKYVASLANQKMDIRPGAIVIGVQPPPPPGSIIAQPLETLTVGKGGAPDPAAESPARKKALSIILPKVEFREATLAEAVDFVSKRALEHDPEGTGVKILVMLGDAPKRATAVNPEDVRITLDLINVSLFEALHYLAGLANLQPVYTKDAVVLKPMDPAPPGVGIPPAPPIPGLTSPAPTSENTKVLITKEWKVSPDLVPKGQTAKGWLTANGIVFNGDTSAIFVPATSRLIVRNTQDELDLIDALLSQDPVQAPVNAPVAITLATRKTFANGDGIEIRDVSGSASTFKVGGTYRVRGICRQGSIQNGSLYLGVTADGPEKAVQPVAGTTLFKAVPKGATEFEFNFTPLRPGKLHVTLYDLDNADQRDNAEAGLNLAEVAP